MKRVGILTSGGDCQGLNPALRALAKSLYEYYEDIEIYGILDGYRGLIYNDYRRMKPNDFSGILTQGGTILGTSRQPFKTIQETDENNFNKVDAMKSTYKKLKLDVLVILGGNGTHKTANLLSEEGLNIVTLPKTIDNDLWGTDLTFGFQSAVSVATNVIDCIHTTALSHGRVFVVEIMGHKVGWLTLYSGIAGGADAILLPEIPYSIDSLIRTMKKREREENKFSIIAAAEGAISKEDAALPKKEYKAKLAKSPYPSVAYEIADKLGKAVPNREFRVCVPGHIQRGGSPCPEDRVLASRLGTAAADLIHSEAYGFMVALKGTEIVSVPLGEVAGKLKSVPKDCDIIHSARDLGISFGD